MESTEIVLFAVRNPQGIVFELFGKKATIGGVAAAIDRTEAICAVLPESGGAMFMTDSHALLAIFRGSGGGRYYGATIDRTLYDETCDDKNCGCHGETPYIHGAFLTSIRDYLSWTSRRAAVVASSCGFYCGCGCN